MKKRGFAQHSSRPRPDRRSVGSSETPQASQVCMKQGRRAESTVVDFAQTLFEAYAARSKIPGLKESRALGRLEPNHRRKR